MTAGLLVSTLIDYALTSQELEHQSVIAETRGPQRRRS
jgi:hypothetical protein